MLQVLRFGVQIFHNNLGWCSANQALLHEPIKPAQMKGKTSSDTTASPEAIDSLGTTTNVFNICVIEIGSPNIQREQTAMISLNVRKETVLLSIATRAEYTVVILVVSLGRHPTVGLSH